MVNRLGAELIRLSFRKSWPPDSNGGRDTVIQFCIAAMMGLTGRDRGLGFLCELLSFGCRDAIKFGKQNAVGITKKWVNLRSVKYFLLCQLASDTSVCKCYCRGGRSRKMKCPKSLVFAYPLTLS
jgi:hypothetical protein